MTDFDKIRYYYSSFDEWQRLDQPEGRLEFEVVISIIKEYLTATAVVLDLGGGPGRYTAALSGRGCQMYLADLSPDLIAMARDKINQSGKAENVIRIDVCNALDLSIYADGMFDAVLLFGPLYHLLSESEIDTCLSEVSRVLKNGGKIFAIYIPWITGLTAVMDRSFYAPEQVDQDILRKTFKEGIFNNKSMIGFQEGTYIKSDKMMKHFEKAGFGRLLLRSIRGIGNRREKYILDLSKSDPHYYDRIMKIITETATDSSVIETGGHAIYVGEKKITDHHKR